MLKTWTKNPNSQSTLHRRKRRWIGIQFNWRNSKNAL